MLGLIKFIKNIAYGIGGGIGFKTSTYVLKDEHVRDFFNDIDTLKKIIENDIAFKTLQKIDNIDKDFTNYNLLIRALGVICMSGSIYVLSKKKLF